MGDTQMKERSKYTFTVDWFSRHLPTWNQVRLVRVSTDAELRGVSHALGLTPMW
jgi:hypothetical protein